MCNFPHKYCIKFILSFRNSLSLKMHEKKREKKMTVKLKVWNPSSVCWSSRARMLKTTVCLIKY